jgi:hypothetical protein
LSKAAAITVVSGLLVAATAVSGAQAADTGRIRAAGPVVATPSTRARSTGMVRTGAVVTLLERRGFWVKVQAVGAQGWLKLSQISLSKDGTGRDIAALATGRTGGGNVVSASGGRGLDNGEDIAKATPNPAAVALVAKLAVSPSAAEAFAQAGRLKTRRLAYVPPPRTPEETRP